MKNCILFSAHYAKTGEGGNLHILTLHNLLYSLNPMVNISNWKILGNPWKILLSSLSGFWDLHSTYSTL